MTLGGVWYGLLAAMIAAYVALDGFDLGAGALLHGVARDERERGLVLRSLGPVWDGNEVWLLAAGGALILAFPRVYAAAFSGFYLPLMLALWLLVFRGMSIELRHHASGTPWIPVIDAAFAVSSGLLALVLGAALGDVVRGVDADAQGLFFEPLFTGFTAKPPLGILDWYTLLAAATALAALTRHGALWLNWKTLGPVRERSALWARRLGPPLSALALLLTAATFRVQPLVARSLARRPWLWAFPALTAASLLLSHRALARGHGLRAWALSALFLAGLVGCAAGGLYPTLLPAAGSGPPFTVANSAGQAHVLRVGLAWWLPGVALACGYFAAMYRSLPKKFTLD